jgi:hypothetical protein
MGNSILSELEKRTIFSRKCKADSVQECFLPLFRKSFASPYAIREFEIEIKTVTSCLFILLWTMV